MILRAQDRGSQQACASQERAHPIVGVGELAGGGHLNRWLVVRTPSAGPGRSRVQAPACRLPFALRGPAGFTRHSRMSWTAESSCHRGDTLLTKAPVTARFARRESRTGPARRRRCGRRAGDRHHRGVAEQPPLDDRRGETSVLTGRQVGAWHKLAAPRLARLCNRATPAAALLH